MTSIIAKKTFIKISAKYTKFANMVSPDLIFKLLKHTKINNHAIKLEDSQQLSYKSIYSLKTVELKTIKAYIKTNLANGFIKPFKLSTNAFIFFDSKLAGFFWLCVNYKNPNKPTITN